MASTGPASQPRTLEQAAPWPAGGRQRARRCAHVPATQRKIEARAAAARRLAAGSSGGSGGSAACRQRADTVVPSASSSSSSSSSATADSDVASALAGLQYTCPNGRWRVRPMNKADASEVRGWHHGTVLHELDCLKRGVVTTLQTKQWSMCTARLDSCCPPPQVRRMVALQTDAFHSPAPLAALDGMARKFFEAEVLSGECLCACQVSVRWRGSLREHI